MMRTRSDNSVVSGIDRDRRAAEGDCALEYLIRAASHEDAEGISRVIVSALRETNAKAYSEAVIARVVQIFSPTAVLGLLERRIVFVAANGNEIIGTASLDGGSVRTVFIQPE